VYDEGIEQIKLADTLGYQTVWCVEHHFRDGRSACPSSEVVLGGLATCTENIRLGFGVVLMPPGFQHPARVAEKVATVDILSHGRVEWGTGRSTPMEQIAFGVPIDDRSRQQWQEATEMVVRMWEQERFSWDSPMITFPERMQTPKPFQDPHPPVWLAAATEKSALNAGKYGLGLLSFALFQPVDVMADVINKYRGAQAEAREAQTEPLTRVRNDRVGAYTLVHCTDDIEEAAHYGLWDSVHWWYQNNAEYILEWELPVAQGHSGGQRRHQAVHRRGHDHHRHARGVSGEDPALRGRGYRPAAELPAVRHVAARQGHAQHRAAGHEDHPRTRGAWAPGRLLRTCRWHPPVTRGPR
jgi:alkanesulfonate monooxygenase SsuD/methylene tetrahydromethanopterin reductase-like flavin-dependent oxidoreductase (luciferase family)